MPRDLELLSEKELFDKTKKIAEYVRNAEIELRYLKGENFVEYRGTWHGKSKFRITLATPTRKNITKYVALLHELGHVIYETPFTQMIKLFKLWNSENQFYYKAMWNVLEDQRIESHLTKGYISYQDKFNRCLRGLGKDLKRDDYDTPLGCLLGIRFYQEKKVKKYNPKYYNLMVKTIKDVEKTDRFGALRMIVILKPLIDEFLADKKKKDADEYYKNKHIEMNGVRGMSGNASTSESSPLSDDSLEKMDKTDAVETLVGDFKKMDDDFKELLTELAEKQKRGESEKLSDEEQDNLINNGKQLGEKQHKEVEDILLNSSTDTTPSMVRKIVRTGNEEYSHNEKVVSEIKKLLKFLQMGKRRVVSHSGDDIDIDEYIENLSKGTDLDHCFIDEGKDEGGKILVSIDTSSSMKGQKIKIARELMATLFKSVENIPNITVKGNLWSSNRIGNIGIEEINSYEDCHKISVDPHYAFTPTHMGIEYSDRMLKEMGGKKNILIIITDGMPNYIKNGGKIRKDIYFDQCYKSFQKLLKNTPNVTVITVSNFNILHTNMKHLFGEKRVIGVRQMEYAAEKVISDFKQMILKTFE